jgi:hypothetical protein
MPEQTAERGPQYHTRNFPDTPSEDYLLNCYVCGAPVHIHKGEEQPHRCRIDLDQQRNRSTRT